MLKYAYSNGQDYYIFFLSLIVDRKEILKCMYIYIYFFPLDSPKSYCRVFFCLFLNLFSYCPINLYYGCAISSCCLEDTLKWQQQMNDIKLHPNPKLTKRSSFCTLSMLFKLQQLRDAFQISKEAGSVSFLANLVFKLLFETKQYVGQAIQA